MSPEPQPAPEITTLPFAVNRRGLVPSQKQLQHDRRAALALCYW